MVLALQHQPSSSLRTSSLDWFPRIRLTVLSKWGVFTHHCVLTCALCASVWVAKDEEAAEDAAGAPLYLPCCTSPFSGAAVSCFPPSWSSSALQLHACAYPASARSADDTSSSEPAPQKGDLISILCTTSKPLPLLTNATMTPHAHTPSA